MATTLYVSPTDPSAAFSSIAAALDHLSKTDKKIPATIHLDAGIYHEKLNIQIPYVTLEGLSADETIITYDDYAYEIMPDGIKRGTFFSYTLFIDAPHVTLKNLTVENASGPSVTCGQAIALYADGDQFTCYNCRLLGKQDTLFVGPLPEKEYEPDGFRGPKEHSPRINTRQYYKDCYICGDVDFIFGSGTAFFENCVIHSLLRDPSADIQGYVTAASTPPGQEIGFIFSNCTLTGDCPQDSVFLGRPWRDYAKTVFLNCTYGEHIHPLGFDDWNKVHAHDTVFFAEYNCSAIGQSDLDRSLPDRQQKREDFVRQLTPEEAAHYDKIMHLIRSACDPSIFR